MPSAVQIQASRMYRRRTVTLWGPLFEPISASFFGIMIDCEPDSAPTASRASLPCATDRNAALLRREWLCSECSHWKNVSPESTPCLAQQATIRGDSRQMRRAKRLLFLRTHFGKPTNTPALLASRSNCRMSRSWAGWFLNCNRKPAIH